MKKKFAAICAIVALSIMFAFTVFAHDGSTIRFYEMEREMLRLAREDDRSEAVWRVAVYDSDGNIVVSIGSVWALADEAADPSIADNFTVVERDGYTVIANGRILGEEGVVVEVVCAYEIANDVLDFIDGRTIDYGFITLLADINDLVGLESGFVYFARPTCPACEVFSPLLFSMAMETETTVIYFNNDQWRGHPLWAEILDSFAVAGVPSVRFAGDGEIVAVAHRPDSENPEEGWPYTFIALSETLQYVPEEPEEPETPETRV